MGPHWVSLRRSGHIGKSGVPQPQLLEAVCLNPWYPWNFLFRLVAVTLKQDSQYSYNFVTR
jgi:hypothetical protein